jgi:hypothetical protein
VTSRHNWNKQDNKLMTYLGNSSYIWFAKKSPEISFAFFPRSVLKCLNWYDEPDVSIGPVTPGRRRFLGITGDYDKFFQTCQKKRIFVRNAKHKIETDKSSLLRYIVT